MIKTEQKFVVANICSYKMRTKKENGTMPLVTIEGVYMASNLKKSTFDGKEKTSLYIDIYQPDSTDNEKTVQIKSDDVGLFTDLNKNFAMGSVFKCTANVNAYKNKAYYKLQKIG